MKHRTLKDYDNPVLIKWQAFLVGLEDGAIMNFLNHWEMHRRKSYNIKWLISFARGLLEYRNDKNNPLKVVTRVAEYEPHNYVNIVV